MTWINLENVETESANELLAWIDIKSTTDCSLPEECCGGGH